MTSSKHLDDQIRDKILENGGDLNITDYPYLIKEAEELGMNQTDLARRIGVVFNTIDWLPYRRIDKLLEPFLEKGFIREKEASEIITSFENELARPEVLNYMLISLKTRHFQTREKNSFEADSFKNIWATEEGYKKYVRDLIVVEWLDEKAHSLPDMGSIMYRNPEGAKYFLRNTNYLVPNVTMLTKSPSKADEFSKIIEGEDNPDKRYLKVMYRLNRELPFRLLANDFSDIRSLFDKTATDYTLFTSAAQQFNDGFIHIWLNETDPINNDRLTKEYDYNSFLKFLYKINNQHPFYLFSQKFDTLLQLAEKAGIEAALWNKIAVATSNGQLLAWLGSTGKQDSITLYNQQIQTIKSSEFYTDEEKMLAITQAFILLINKNAAAPHLTSDQQKIQLLSIEGSYPVEHVLNLNLESSGYVKAKVYIDKGTEGLSLDKETATFFSQNNLVNQQLVLSIDALKLIKEKLYAFNIIVQTQYEVLSIPVEVKVVFPKKAYYKQLIKYALFGGVFFAFIRFLTGFMTDNSTWFSLNELNNQYGYADYLPHNYFFYFIGIALLIGGLTASIFLIRKIEKI